ncbi:hypothetical protein JYT20_01320 [Rhodothermus sp. AH-315-K08]|nr:hypothetical protein [Rhodothermus sp. AH-315-K08]
MKSTLSLFVATLFLFAGTMFPAPAEDITVTGRLVDTKCYGMMPEANFGNDHMLPKMKDGMPIMHDGMPEMMTVPMCGTACSSMGIPTGIVEGGAVGGRTYVIIASTTALSSYIAQEARVTGTLAFDGGIIASKIEVKGDDGRWEDVTPAAMM